jgi:SnoaL-like domain
MPEPSAPTHHALREIYDRQSFAIDEGDAEAWAQTFTRDGTFSSPTYGTPRVGRPDLIEFVNEFKRAARQHRHWMGSFVLEQVESGWQTRCYALIIGIEAGAAPQILRSVVITDTWVYQDGDWRIHDRTVRVDGAA